jgi:hypothetical protein
MFLTFLASVYCAADKETPDEDQGYHSGDYEEFCVLVYSIHRVAGVELH